MEDSDFDRIKQKMISLDSKRYWGDDFDVRFYLTSRLKDVTNKKVLDLGGGVGIISSELDSSNQRINVDFSLDELQMCTKMIDSSIMTVCSSITDIPFNDATFDYVISSSVIQYLRSNDISKNNVNRERNIPQYLSVEKCISEIHRVLKPNGMLYLVTPNNSYYKSYMFDYYELKSALSSKFKKFKLFFFNTYPKITNRSRKLNLANVVPKLRFKFSTKQKLLNSMLKEDEGFSKNSVSFYVEAIKD